jgi:cysteine synthase
MGNNHYSRYWIPHLFLAEGLGIITPGLSKIIEVTSGSSGISLSMAAQILGYDLTMIIPETLPKGRVQPMLEAGTKIIKAPGYIDACIVVLQQMLKDNPEYFAANHSDEKSNLVTHVFSRIAIEYQDECGNPDYAILGLGNGSTTESIAKVFRSRRPEPVIYAYRPSFDKNEMVLGLLAPNLNLKHVKPAMELVDKLVYTTDMQIDPVKILFEYDTEIINLGYSSLYAIRFAMLLADEYEGKSIFTIGYDKIDRYLD